MFPGVSRSADSRQITAATNKRSCVKGFGYTNKELSSYVSGHMRIIYMARTGLAIVLLGLTAVVITLFTIPEKKVVALGDV